MKANVIVVYPGPWWGWEVVRDGDTKVEPMSFDEQQPAMEYANAMASAMTPCWIRIEDLRGRVVAEWEAGHNQPLAA